MQFLYYYLLNYEYSFLLSELHPLVSDYLLWYSIFGMLRRIGLELYSYLLSKLVTVPMAKAVKFLLNFVMVTVNYISFPTFSSEGKECVFCLVV